MGERRHAVIVGGGIGGLASAVGLRLAGFRVTVLERAPELSEVGSAITLWPNALRGLGALGLSDRIAPLLSEQPGGGMRNSRGRWLAHWDADQVKRVLGDPLLAIHRADLIDLLRRALPEHALRTGVTVTDVNDDRVRWDDGEIRADLVVGADGIHSVVRSALWPRYPGPSYGGATAFRAVLDDVPRPPPSITFGPGTEFGVVPLADDRLYWYVALKAPANIRPDEPKALLRERFTTWHAQAREIIERTPRDRILHNDLYQLDVPLPRFHRGRVALLGDAAHAMPPFLGQGGCQAIEDAVELAASVADSANLADALARYDLRRRPRSQAIVRQSIRTGRLGARLSQPLAVAARDALTRVLPADLSLRTFRTATRWTPPSIGDPRG